MLGGYYAPDRMPVFFFHLRDYTRIGLHCSVGEMVGCSDDKYDLKLFDYVLTL